MGEGKIKSDIDQNVLKQAGIKIRFFRRRLGLTQSQLASAAQMTVRHFQKIESGTINATIDSYYKLSKTLGVCLTELFSPPAFRCQESSLLHFQDDSKSSPIIPYCREGNIISKLQSMVDKRNKYNSVRVSKFLSKQRTRSINNDSFASGIIVRGRMYIDDYATQYGNYETNHFSFGQHFTDYGLGAQIVEDIESINSQSIILIKTKIEIPIGEIPIVASFKRVSKSEVIVVFKYLDKEVKQDNKGSEIATSSY